MTDPTLSAALEDAEGRKLVQDILGRKELRNARDRFLQMMIWGDVFTDGHGNVIPRELPGYWSAVKDLWDRNVDAKITHTRALNRPATTRIEGPRISAVWLDEPYRLAVSGRGHGKRSYLEKIRERATKERVSLIPVTETPTLDPSAVKWSCSRPTERNQYTLNNWANETLARMMGE